jgi:hypothetical protein
MVPSFAAVRVSEAERFDVSFVFSCLGTIRTLCGMIPQLVVKLKVDWLFARRSA